MQPMSATTTPAVAMQQHNLRRRRSSTENDEMDDIHDDPDYDMHMDEEQSHDAGLDNMHGGKYTCIYHSIIVQLAIFFVNYLIFVCGTRKPRPNKERAR